MKGDGDMFDLIAIIRSYLDRQNSALEQIAKNEAQLIGILQQMGERISSIEEKLKLVEVMKWVIMVLLAMIVWVITGKLIPPLIGS